MIKYFLIFSLVIPMFILNIFNFKIFKRNMFNNKEKLQAIFCNTKYNNEYNGLNNNSENAKNDSIFNDITNKKNKRNYSTGIKTPDSLKIVKQNYSEVKMKWEIKNREKITNIYIDRKVENQDWVLNYGILGNKSSTFTDNKPVYNNLVYYRVGTKNKDKKFSIPTMPVKSFILKDNFITINSNKFYNDLLKKEVIIDYDYEISPFEITNQEYIEILNYALQNNLLTGDFINNVTVKNKIGTPKELIDLNDRNCLISFKKDKFIVDKEYKNFPVTEVTWYGAAFYCNIRSFKIYKETNFIPLYNQDNWECINYKSLGYRLPTEAEWILAAKNNDLKYPWKNTENNFSANIFESKIGKVINVGSFSNSKNKQSLIFDFIGNATEWIDDWYTISPLLEDINPVNTSQTRLKVLKGGSFQNKFKDLSIKYRDKSIPEQSSEFIGFRIVKYLKLNK